MPGLLPVTTTSMPTSRKRTKKRRKIKFPVLVLGICLVCAVILLAAVARGCGETNDERPGSDPVTVSETAATVQTAGSYSGLVGHKVTVSADAELYSESPDGVIHAGRVPAGTLLDISGERMDMLEIADSPFLVQGDAVSLSDRWFRNETRLCPYSEDLHTTSSFTLYAEDGSIAAQIDRECVFPVYVKPGEDGKYGIRYQNAVYYISETDVASTEPADRTQEPAAAEIPVLMYHFFYSTEDGGRRVDGNYVEVNELDEQLNYIRENGFHACSMRELLYWMEGRAILPEHSIAVTIDDADPSVHQYAMPVFVKYGIHATNFVICGWQPAEMPYELWEMRENGMELQSHGFLTHTGGCSGMGHGGLLMCMDHDAGVEDTLRSFDYVDGGFVYCYPFGDINDNAESIVRDAGGKLAFTTEGGRINPSMDPLALPRVRVTGGNGLAAFAASIGWEVNDG